MVTLSTRSVRTFVLRQGRLTEGQQKSLDQYWPSYGLELPETGQLDLQQCFQSTGPVWLEIGFGNGEALVAMAKTRPEVNFLGVEVHLPGVGHALGEIAAHELQNVRIIRYDALELLENHLPANSVDRLSLFFPDPWHKKRHRKRRIVNPEFLRFTNQVVIADGVMHIATDWESYAEHIKEEFALCEFFTRVEDETLHQKVVEARPLTKFEQRGLRLGHKVTDLVYRNTP